MRKTIPLPLLAMLLAALLSAALGGCSARRTAADMDQGLRRVEVYWRL